VPPTAPPHTLPRRALIGARAEQAVADYLLARGFSILHRNLRVGHLEVDLLARLDDLVAVVEVRHRGPGSWQGPLESISPAKRARLRKAGRLIWQRRFARDPSVNRMRFDAAAVSFDPDGTPRVDYVSAAF
jgi:putative endonuclease